MAYAKTVEAMTIVGIEILLSRIEAETLAAVLRKISGNPDDSSRKHTEAIRLALKDVGVDGDPDDSDRLGLRGNIHCDSQ